MTISLGYCGVVHHLEAHCMITRLAGQIITKNINNNNNNDDCKNNINSIESLQSLSATVSSTVKFNITSVNNHFIPKVNFPFLVLLASGSNLTL